MLKKFIYYTFLCKIERFIMHSTPTVSLNHFRSLRHVKFVFQSTTTTINNNNRPNHPQFSERSTVSLNVFL